MNLTDRDLLTKLREAEASARVEERCANDEESGAYFEGKVAAFAEAIEVVEQAGIAEAALTIKNYLDWQQAIHGGCSTEDAHRALVAEGRPKPSLDEALEAVSALLGPVS